MIRRVSIGDEITADKFNEIIDSLNNLRISGVGKIMVSGNLESGFSVAVRGITASTSEEVTATPKPFDILSNGGGKVKIHQCWYMNGSKFVQCQSEPEINVASGILCAVINTGANPIEVTLGFDVEFSRNTPELFPVPLYRVLSNGTSVTVLTDLRGTAVVFYE